MVGKTSKNLWVNAGEIRYFISYKSMCCVYLRLPYINSLFHFLEYLYINMVSVERGAHRRRASGGGKSNGEWDGAAGGRRQ